MKRLLVIRFSAMGDVAMTVPVVTSLARQYPELRITVLTQQCHAPMFDWMPANVEVLGVDLSKVKGVPGLERLFLQLHKRRFDLVADLHDVLRTKYLRTRFRLTRARIAVIDKGRKEKKALIGNALGQAPLKSTFERYADVFRQLDLNIQLDFTRAFDLHHEPLAPVESRIGRKKAGDRWVGIAPFAAHPNKIYPLDHMQQVAAQVAAQGCRVFLFGAGQRERDILESWTAAGIESVAGRMGGLHNELLLMAQLDCMVSMDSANMHLASLVGTPVVSIWGATHPSAGFTPWNQPADRIVQCEDLDCRPCSVYGNRPCRWGDLRCLTRLEPAAIVARICQSVNCKS